MLFVCEHFHNFIHRRPITVFTDHKPLIGSNKKPMDFLSPRLQKMMLRILRHQIDLQYIPGKENFVADVLTRNPQPIFLDTKSIEPIEVHTISITTNEKLTEFKNSRQGIISSQILHSKWLAKILQICSSQS